MSDNNYDPDLHEPLPEGEEAAPPLTHTMSIVRWVILAGISLFAFAMLLSFVGLAPWEARADDASQYHCPMHPTYISDQPGDCPICGMSLVPIDKAGKEVKEEKQTEKADDKVTEGAEYTCPMHPEVTSDKPDECPKCGMDLVKLEKKSTEQYACPMHPDVKSDKPGECPKCGMDLLKTKSKEVAYICPMHPDVISNQPRECSKCSMDLIKSEDKPGRCPKCKMFLEPTVGDTTKTNHKNMDDSGSQGDDHSSDMGEAPVPGLVPITIEPERLQLIGVRTEKVQHRSLGDALEIVGYITPDETRTKNVTSRISGWVQNLFVDETGQYVEAGKPLLSLYSQELYQAEQDFMVARDALKNSAADEGLLSMRRHIYSASREKLRLLGLNDDQISEIEKLDIPSPQFMITSPYSGYVLEKNIIAGQYITSNQNLFTVADLGSVWVLGDIYEKDITRINKGQKVSMTLTAFPGETFKGTIDFIYPSVSSTTRAAKIRASFANPNRRISPGMYAKLSLESSERLALAIPVDAVIDGGKEQYVFVVHDGTHFEPRMVTIGRSSDDYIEIINGLRDGETVVTSANFLIDSESRLQAAITGMGGTEGHSH